MSTGAIDRRAVGALGILLLALAACGAASFACDEPADCRDGERVGQCQPEGV
ncbi:MAG: hypothetical protein IAG13_10410, partial [Deltaproteobacteria bacterium]|nr:hypothetical protein [Nannocystaceae bacterium]